MTCSVWPVMYAAPSLHRNSTFSALVVAESVGADAGLGYLIVDSRNYFKMPNMLLAAALSGIEYTIFERVLRLAERRLFRWRRAGLEHALER